MVSSVSDIKRGQPVTDAVPDVTEAREFYEKYELKNILGSGISSVVRRCIEKETGHEFAVKIIDLSPGQGQGEVMDEEDLSLLRAATLKEIQILRLCSEHPHIITLHETFVNDSCIFLILELCRNGELFDYLNRVVKPTKFQTREIMRQLFSALDFLHSRNIVHRDVKPENILLDDNYNVKLSDFGCVAEISDSGALTDLCGTACYLAPEVLRFNLFENAPGYGKEVDIWACGVIMYTLLVGCPPFWNQSKVAMYQAIFHARYSFSSPEWKDVSQTSKQLISRMLTVSPHDRITSGQALQDPFFHTDAASSSSSSAELPASPSNNTPLKSAASSSSEISTGVKRLPRFKAVVFCVFAIRRLALLGRVNVPSRRVTFAEARDSPYAARALREIIDASAFRMYGHWVQHEVGHERGALFERSPKQNIVQCSSPTLPQSCPQSTSDTAAPAPLVGAHAPLVGVRERHRKTGFAATWVSLVGQIQA